MTKEELLSNISMLNREISRQTAEIEDLLFSSENTEEESMLIEAGRSVGIANALAAILDVHPFSEYRGREELLDLRELAEEGINNFKEYYGIEIDED